MVACFVLPAAGAGFAPAIGAQTGSTELEPKVPAISAIHAHLFRNKSGTWSEDVLDPKYGGSWNTIAGPNSANATLVVVEVSGPPRGTYTGYFGPETKYMVRLVAREGENRLLLDQTQVIPVLDDRGRVLLAFLLHQSGCRPVQLAASIVGKRAAKPVIQSLNFACGE